jgi:hypothetical protein
VGHLDILIAWSVSVEKNEKRCEKRKKKGKQKWTP